MHIKKLPISNEELIELYKTHTLKQLADMFSVDKRTIERRLTKAEIPMPPKRKIAPSRAHNLPPIKELIELYQTHSAGEIAIMYDTTSPTVRSKLTKAKIQLRGCSEAQNLLLKLRKNNNPNIGASGPNHWHWKGGRRINTQGYFIIYKPDELDAMCDGMVFEHRFVWKQHNGEIPKGGVIHHKNGDKLDNRIENLELSTHESHKKVIPELMKRIAELEALTAHLICPIQATEHLLGC